MLKKARSRFGAPGVIAVIALVFAMAGGAWAAGGGLSSKQKKEVQTIAKTEAKKLVKAGPEGKQGPTGSQGSAGRDGTNGANGSAGAPGKSVVVGTAGAECTEGGVTVEVEGSGTKKAICNGETGLEGEPGPEGSPWTAGGTLPSGKSEYGTWSAGPLAKEQFGAWTSISVPVHLATAPALHYMGEGATPTTPCPGTFEEPKAAPGNMCVYRSGGFALAFETEEDPETGLTGEGAGKAGVNLFFSGEEFQSARGVWVVTAP